jgi:hypothetical protein
MGVLGGVLLKRPLFYDNYASGTLYREFKTIRDIKQTETTLNEIFALDHLLSLMDIPLERMSAYGYFSYKNMLLTAWARSELKLPKKLAPLEPDVFRPFFETLFEPGAAGGLEEPKKTRRSMKAAFLNWVSGESGMDPMEISQVSGQVFEGLFREIETEYGAVSPKDLDPRFVVLFLLDRK